jgi:hypothetical protein
MTNQTEPAQCATKSRFARVFGLCAFVAGIAVATCPSASAQNQVKLSINAVPASNTLAITHGPFLQAPSERGVTLSWATSVKCVSRVEYRPESSTHWLTNIPTRHGLVDADVTVQNVALTGLQPGTPYHCWISSLTCAGR